MDNKYFLPQAVQCRVIVVGVDGEGSVGHSGLCSHVSKVILDNAILRIVADGEDVLILYLLDGALDDVAAILISIILRLSGAGNTIRHSRFSSPTLGFIVCLWSVQIP